MRVLYVSPGGSVHDRRFLQAIQAAGLQVGWLRLVDHPIPPAVPAGVLDLSPRPAPGDRPWHVLRARRALATVMRAFRPTVVHAGPIQQAAFVAALAGARPLVSMSWGSDLLRNAARGWGRWQAKYVLGRSQLLLCDCQVVRRRAIELGAAQDRIVVFPWGVDLQRFRPGRRSSIRAQLGWEDSFVVLSARTLEPIYGVDILIEGFVRAAAGEPRLRLLLLSDGGMRDSLVRTIDRAGLQARVHFAGAIEEGDLPDYYRAADLYVSASRSDGSSVTLLEAMACGVPVLVSDIPGNREWVDPDDGGWLFRDGEPDALAGGLRRALVGSRRLAEMGRKGRAKVVAQADWRANSQMLLDAYQFVASQGQRRAP